MNARSGAATRRQSARRILSLASACAVVVGFCGCSTPSRDYPGVESAALWSAAISAARQPKYSDWFVAENAVFVDEVKGRIEVHRELKRDYAPPGGALRRECETWSMSIRVDAVDRVPVVTVESRTRVPAMDFWKQAEHYFGEIDARLAQVPSDSAIVPGVTTSSGEADPNGLLAPAALESSAQFNGASARPQVPDPSQPQSPLAAP